MDCVYIFDIRTSRACATVSPPQASSSVSPLGVFAIIGGVAFVVYFFAGCIYRRRVLHKVGWQQVPHIDGITAIFSFIKVLSPLEPLRCVGEQRLMVGYDCDYFCKYVGPDSGRITVVFGE